MVHTFDTAATCDDHVTTQVRRRRRAALRLPPVPETGLRDPLLERHNRDRKPSTFGLTPRELTAEARRLRACGWQPWEIEMTLRLPHIEDAR